VAERILVVDDKPQNHRLIQAMLAPYGYAIASASSGEEAVRVITSDPPDLILLDVVMPGMTGYEVCRWVRANDSTRVLPIVMVTANPEQDKVAAIEAGADDFIVEPFERELRQVPLQNEIVGKEFEGFAQKIGNGLAASMQRLEERHERQAAALTGVHPILLTSGLHCAAPCCYRGVFIADHAKHFAEVPPAIGSVGIILQVFAQQRDVARDLVKLASLISDMTQGNIGQSNVPPVTAADLADGGVYPFVDYSPEPDPRIVAE